MQDIITKYYNNLAPIYDADRFGNTYGKYIDCQERKILQKLFDGNFPKMTLDIACGTGRLMDFASHGLDISPNMLKEAKEKFPEKKFTLSSALNTELPSATFEAILSFHFIMHLDKQDTDTFLEESHRLLQTGGKLIVDFPSDHRRKLVNHQTNNWHAANNFRIDDWENISDKWIVKQYFGILFFPIHRFPKKIRKFARHLDSFICNTFLRKYASYIIIVLQKK